MWVVRLTDKQLEVLRALLRSEEHLGPALKGSIEALDLEVLVTETVMRDHEDRRRLAAEILDRFAPTGG